MAGEELASTAPDATADTKILAVETRKYSIKMHKTFFSPSKYNINLEEMFLVFYSGLPK